MLKTGVPVFDQGEPFKKTSAKGRVANTESESSFAREMKLDNDVILVHALNIPFTY